MAGTCWYCNKQAAVPESSTEIQLHRGTAERTFSVPACPACEQVVVRANLWSLFPGLIGLLVAVGAGIFAGVRVADLADRSLTELSSGAAGWGTFFGVALITGFAGLAVSKVLLRRAGLASKHSLWNGPRHPELRKLQREGWKTGPVPTEKPSTSPGYLTSKSCGRCGRTVPLASHAGDRCPHCGARWSYERASVQP